MTDDTTPKTDPLDAMPPFPPGKGATREEIAVAAYEAFGSMMAALATQVDDTKAKNYVAIQFEGFKFPFDRGEVHFIRPGGLSPVQRAEGLSVMVDHLRDDVRKAEEDRHNAFIANAEIAVELTDRITGATPIDTEERFLAHVRAMESSLATMREVVRATEVKGTVALAALKTAREAIMGDLDHGKALDDIDRALESLGVVL